MSMQATKRGNMIKQTLFVQCPKLRANCPKGTLSTVSVEKNLNLVELLIQNQELWLYAANLINFCILPSHLDLFRQLLEAWNFIQDKITISFQLHRQKIFIEEWVEDVPLII